MNSKTLMRIQLISFVGSEMLGVSAKCLRIFILSLPKQQVCHNPVFEAI